MVLEMNPQMDTYPKSYELNLCKRRFKEDPWYAHCISKMYFSHWEPPGVSERMWSVNLEVSISGKYQTLGGHSGRPSE